MKTYMFMNVCITQTIEFNQQQQFKTDKSSFLQILSAHKSGFQMTL